jgi:hypothetical protein
MKLLRVCAPFFRERGKSTAPNTPQKLSGNARLHVIAVYFNHCHFQNIKINFERFRQYMGNLGVTLHVVEMALNGADFEVTEANNIHHLQYRTSYEFFHKENLINLGAENAITLYGDQVQKLAWIDCDVFFANPKVIEHTLHALDRYQVVQMFSTAVDLDPTCNPLQNKIVVSFGQGYVDSNPGVINSKEFHPGYAWAMRRSTWEKMGGLLDTSIIGSGDRQMACAFIQRSIDGLSQDKETPQAYQEVVMNKLQKISDVVQGDLGVVHGMLLHYWHGAKSSRNYVNRRKILIESEFDPARDLIIRTDGVIELTGNNPKLLAGMKRYFNLRNDDCNVTEGFFTQKL